MRQPIADRLEELLAEAIALRFAEKPTRDVLNTAKTLGPGVPRDLIAVVDLLAGTSPDIAIPYLSARVAAIRKIGEGIGQARKLVRWAGFAYLDNDTAVIAQLIPKLEQLRCKDSHSQAAVQTAWHILSGPSLSLLRSSATQKSARRVG